MFFDGSSNILHFQEAVAPPRSQYSPAYPDAESRLPSGSVAIEFSAGYHIRPVLKEHKLPLVRRTSRTSKKEDCVNAQVNCPNTLCAVVKLRNEIQAMVPYGELSGRYSLCKMKDSVNET
jgi:hypothetical protein